MSPAPNSTLPLNSSTRERVSVEFRIASLVSSLEVCTTANSTTHARGLPRAPTPRRMRAFATLAPILAVALTTATLGAQTPQRADSTGRDSVPTTRRRAQLEPVIVTGSLGSGHNIGVATSVVTGAQLAAEPSR